MCSRDCSEPSWPAVRRTSSPTRPSSRRSRRRLRWCTVARQTARTRAVRSRRSQSRTPSRPRSPPSCVASATDDTRHERARTRQTGPVLLEDRLAARVGALIDTGARRILGIVGAPGAGKSTLAAAVAAAFPGQCVVVPMDGFHLAQSELERLGRAERKGAPDTFDAAGYVALLRRLREPVAGETVYVPEYHRELHNAVAGAIPVPAEVPLVLTEGNYLLLDTGAWVDVGELLDEAWFITVPDEDRLERLVARHLAGGKSPAEAHVWAHGSDERNTELVAATADAADRSVSAGVVAEVHRRVMEDWAP